MSTVALVLRVPADWQFDVASGAFVAPAVEDEKMKGDKKRLSDDGESPAGWPGFCLARSGRGEEARQGRGARGEGRLGWGALPGLLGGQHAVASGLADAEECVDAVEDAVGEAVALDALAAAGRPAGAGCLGFGEQAGVGGVDERDGEGVASTQEDVFGPVRLVVGDAEADLVAGLAWDARPLTRTPYFSTRCSASMPARWSQIQRNWCIPGCSRGIDWGGSVDGMDDVDGLDGMRAMRMPSSGLAVGWWW